MTFGKGCHLHLIDGSAYIFRAFHALPPLTRKSDGLPIGAVSGFCNMLDRYLERNEGPDAATHLAVIFDKGSHTFRNDIYPDYKGHRPELPEDLRPQIPLTREATRAFNVACEEMEGFEADDIIATLARQVREAGGRCTIVSADKDLMQLVGGGVEMTKPGIQGKPDETIDVEGVEKYFGVGPDRVVDVQALAGDSTDNVPGAPGIGIKTAAQLIGEWGDLDNLLANAEAIKQPKRRETLLEKADQIRMSRELVRLDDDVPLAFTLDDLELRAPEPDALLDFLNRMEFRTLTRRIAERFEVEPPKAPDIAAEPNQPAAVEMPAIDHSVYETVTDEAGLQSWIDRINAVGIVAVDTETTSLNEMTAELVGISLSTGAGAACYVPLGHKSGEDDLFGTGTLAEGQMPLDRALEMLGPVLEDPAVLKIGQNMKYDFKIFARYGVTVAPIDDTMLLSYAQHSGLHAHGMDVLADRYLNHQCIPIKELIGTGKSAVTFDRVPIDKAAPYAAEDAEVTWRLWHLLKPRLHSEHVTQVYETLERPMVPVLARMEMHGIQVDRDHLSRMSGAFAQKMAELEADIHALAGKPFNVGSPSQLGEILFDEMGLPGGKKTKTGAWATGADVLEDLATEHDLARRVLDWRQIAKLKNTYTDNLQTHINDETGRVHTSYSIAGANTGRLASSDPNLQNIPVRTEEGRRIREAFVAPEGRVLVSLDYSQIELRLLTEFADVPALEEAFRAGHDIHSVTASEMFGVPLDEMTPDVRRSAKAINYGIVYGISGFGLARNLRIPREEASEFIKRYFEKFPGIKDYMDETTERAKKDGFVTTLFGRKVHTPGVGQKGPQAGYARRAAINAPIQGSNADIIRRAMARMEAAIEGIDARMLLQVHDELLFEAAEDAADALIERAREVMEGANMPVRSLSVPIVVDAGVGKTWAEAH
ncbi:DNA polymerase I [Jannaschia aquimarina]|uniref:DNA polymerase I n=1 Tax=Jannaschia aquimarina TaxID=935700 RepID=A0A0D1DAS0_9RHOB|nr:DNA polymerase I [Jannaschia aquimarina]KIT17038.1 DNA polymerase I [Jannaschia aquimarina]SNS82024.1 DNA polymerase I [Jannaschia aquimarina]